jgi:hypothetical protein
MKEQNEIQLAWEIWNLIDRLNTLIWDHYEDEFIEIYLKDEEKKYFSTLSPPGNSTSEQNKSKTPT